MTPQSLATAPQTILSRFIADLRRASAFWWRAALAGLAVVAVFAIAATIDDRLIHGVSVWDKPAKFMLSFVVHTLTFAYAFALMPKDERRSTSNRVLSMAFVVIFGLEVLYMAVRAWRGEASHFNTGTTLAATLYALMGIGAVGLTAITAWFGWRLVRRRSDSGARAAGTGLMLGGFLGAIAGIFMAQQTGHWVGGMADDANGLPLMQWSTSGGDLRVAHFMGLHAMQAVPLAVWLWPRQRTLWLAAVAMTLLTAAVFRQAVAGMPLFAA